MTEKEKSASGLDMEVYKQSAWGDCTINGISSQKKSLVINEDIKLKQGHFKGTCVAYPIEEREGGFYCFGGNYLASSDSRIDRYIDEICGHRFYGAIPIHDRFEPYQN